MCEPLRIVRHHKSYGMRKRWSVARRRVDLNREKRWRETARQMERNVHSIYM